MPVSSVQRQRVLDAISEKRLPLDPPTAMYAGYGTGRVCMGCGEPIGRREVEYEADYRDGRTYVLHLGCASVWDAERRRQTASEDAKSIRAQSKASREQARRTAKEAGQLRDRADVLRTESQAMKHEAKHAKRGQNDADGS